MRIRKIVLLLFGMSLLAACTTSSWEQSENRGFMVWTSTPQSVTDTPVPTSTQTSPAPTETIPLPTDTPVLHPSATLTVENAGQATEPPTEKVTLEPDAEATPTRIPVANPHPVDLSDLDAIVYGLAYDLAYGTQDSFQRVFTGSILLYGAGIAGSRYEIAPETFLEYLAERIPNGPGCAGYVMNVDRKSVQVFTTGWNPLWEEPGGAKSDQIIFTITFQRGKILVTAYFTPSSGILEVVDHQACPFFE